VSGQASVAYFEADPAVLATIAVVAVPALAAAALARRRRLPLALTGLSLAVVLGVTLVPAGGWHNFAVAPDALRSVLANLAPRPTDATAWALAGDGPLNVLLFVPLGLFLGVLLRRPVTAAVSATGLSLAIECYQAALTTRVGSLADVVANGVGAAIGAIAAALFLVGRHAVASSRTGGAVGHRPRAPRGSADAAGTAVRERRRDAAGWAASGTAGTAWSGHVPTAGLGHPDADLPAGPARER
jgi:VanZ family protein